jgi:hypothetical protein
MLNAIPFGKTTIASYLAALYLIKEKYGLSDRALAKIIRETTGLDPRQITLEESSWYLNEEGNLRSGTYSLINDIALPSTGETLALSKSKVSISENATPCGKIFGVDIYKALHYKTRQTILVTQHDLKQ